MNAGVYLRILRFRDGIGAISGMRVRRNTNQFSLLFRCKSQKNEGRTHICEWITSLSDGACHSICSRADCSISN